MFTSTYDSAAVGLSWKKKKMRPRARCVCCHQTMTASPTGSVTLTKDVPGFSDSIHNNLVSYRKKKKKMVTKTRSLSL